jgi:Protein of unknown function (DUF3634)
LTAAEEAGIGSLSGSSTMLDILTQLVILALAGAIIFAILVAAFVPRYHFIITIKHGKPRVTRGKVQADFLDQVREVCEEDRVTSGWIGGVKRGKPITLRFSRSIPPGCRQRLRNIWFNV